MKYTNDVIVRSCDQNARHGKANHTINTNWGIIFLCQGCAESRAVFMSLGLPPREEPVCFRLYEMSHSSLFSNVLEFDDLNDALGDLYFAIKRAEGCSDHEVVLTVSQGDKSIDLKRYSF